MSNVQHVLSDAELAKTVIGILEKKFRALGFLRAQVRPIVDMQGDDAIEVRAHFEDVSHSRALLHVGGVVMDELRGLDDRFVFVYNSYENEEIVEEDDGLPGENAA
jgi:hypothetical protein